MLILPVSWSSLLFFFSCSIKKYGGLPPEMYWLYSILLLLTWPSLFTVSVVLVLLNFDSAPRGVGPVLEGHLGWSILRVPSD